MKVWAEYFEIFCIAPQSTSLYSNEISNTHFIWNFPVIDSYVQRNAQKNIGILQLFEYFYNCSKFCVRFLKLVLMFRALRFGKIGNFQNIFTDSKFSKNSKIGNLPKNQSICIHFDKYSEECLFIIDIIKTRNSFLQFIKLNLCRR